MLSKNFVLSFALLFVGATTIVSVQGGSIDILDGTYVLQWAIVGDNLEVEATVRGTGYVGFGIGPFTNMSGADIFVAGVKAEDDSTYHWDMHGVGNNFPVMDEVDNYELLGASENDTYTTVNFRRLLVSTDRNEDLDITNTVQYIMWAVGSNDNLEYHFSNRGLLELNLFDDPEK